MSNSDTLTFDSLKSQSKQTNFLNLKSPGYDWFVKNKKEIFKLLLSKSFNDRNPDRMDLLIAFQMYLDKKSSETSIFWKAILNEKRQLNNDKKPNDFIKNNNVKKFKKEIRINNSIFKRFLIKTSLFKKNDDYLNLIKNYIINNQSVIQKNKKWFVVVSEKIIAVSQGRSYFIWEIKPSFLAYFLSKYVKKSPYGIGLGSPWTMELALKEVGWLRIVIASFISVLFKAIGINGVFYSIAGAEARSIDGPTAYSIYPSNVSAKLGPKNPQSVALNLKKSLFETLKDNFIGVVVIDANDIGQNILGNSTELDDHLIEKIMKDNPMGQSDEQTPILIVQYN